MAGPPEIRPIFQKVEEGLSSGSISGFSPYFGSQVSLNLRGGENGVYSANQAYYVLENYLRHRRVMQVNFSSISETGTNPYATGSAGLNTRGGRELAQIYVSLSRVGERWVITQINIY